VKGPRFEGAGRCDRQSFEEHIVYNLLRQEAGAELL
jgi:hypothetical protein